MTIPARQKTAFDLPLSESPSSGLEQDDDLLDKIVADYKRISVVQERHFTLQEEGVEDIAWSRDDNRQQDSIDNIVVPFSKRLPRNINTRSFNPTTEWEGYVEAIGEEEFTVRLVDIKSPSSLAEETATFTIRELGQRERHLLVPGAIVRWIVGLERLPTDQRRRVSELHFRDLPAHSVRDHERARSKAKDLLASIVLDEGS
ncbi:MAG: hypothetical protein OXF88_10465 [Rhodobacteraceae bacterium]|nr:hypothetical protein [Paracoccaceae bacterium]MCY4141591.1 hypothetical protein [Paracoccaceae bacterium]